MELFTYQPPAPRIILQNSPSYDPKTEERVFISLTKDGVVVTEDQELEYTHYLTGEGAKADFEMYLSSEARVLVNHLGWKKVRSLFEQDTADITKEPFGQRSLDPTKDEYDSKIRRSVNSLSKQLEESLDLEVAVKGTGIHLPPGDERREDLVKQYLRMRLLQIQSRTLLTEEQKEIIEFCPVYGVIRYNTEPPIEYQEWLLMKKIYGVGVEDVGYAMAVMGPYPEVEPGFDHTKYPLLAKALRLREYPTWSDAKSNLRRQGLAISDLSGRNILEWRRQDTGRSFYTIIDQK